MTKQQRIETVKYLVQDDCRDALDECEFEKIYNWSHPDVHNEWITEILMKKLKVQNPLEYIKNNVPQSMYKGLDIVTATVEEGVTGIMPNAFENCKQLESIYIPDSVETIGWATFRGCISLKKVVANNCGIAMAAFNGCTSLEEVCLPKSGVLANAFSGCKNLKRVSINVEKLGDAFSDCRGTLTDLTLGEDLEQIYPGTFSPCYKLKIIKYLGTREQWRRVTKTTWEELRESPVIQCLDGDIDWDGNEA